MQEEEEEAVDHSPAAGDEIKVSAAIFFQKCSEKPADKEGKKKEEIPPGNTGGSVEHRQ